MVRREGDIDVDPIDSMPDDPDAILERGGRRRSASEELDSANDDRRLPRPSRTRDMDQPGMDPAGEGDSER